MLLTWNTAARTARSGSYPPCQTRAGTTSYYLADAQGSVRALADAAGTVTDSYDYAAFGELFGSSGTTANSYLYTGQQFDALTGLYSLRARYYEPGVGRFLSRDPMEVQTFAPLELNRYVYAANNPVNLADPRGRDSFVERVVVAAVAFTAAQPLAAVGLAAFAAIYVPYMLFGLAQIAGAPPRDLPRFPALPRVDTEALRRAAEATLALAATITGCVYLRSVSVQMAINHEGVGLAGIELALPSPNPCHIPVLLYPGPVSPGIAQHIHDAQNSGRPMLLNYLGPLNPQAAINYELACPRAVRLAMNSQGLSCDEYPFKTTAQGGLRASARGVPPPEQRFQGVFLTAFYGTKLQFKASAAFAVVVFP